MTEAEISDAAVNQGMPRIDGRQQKLERGKEIFWGEEEWHSSDDTLILDLSLQNEIINFC